MTDIKHQLRRKLIKAFLFLITSLLILVLAFAAVLLLWPRGVEPVDPVEARKWVNEHRRRLEQEGRYNPDGSWKGPRVAIIGVDGLDFDEATKLMAQGRLPNLARIMKEGAAGKILTLNPTLSPRIWTTIATGVLPRNHGIVNIYLKQSDTGQFVPMDSSYRKFPALWNIASEFGLKVLVISYWPTWPVEKVNGVIISDMVTFGLRRVAFDGSFIKIARLKRVTYPPEEFDKILPVISAVAPIKTSDLTEFLNARPNEISEIESKNKLDLRSHIEMLRMALVSDKFSLSAGINLYRKHNPDLFMIYLKGLDLVCHRFWKYHEPDKFPEVSEKEILIAGDVIRKYYEYVDEMIAKLVEEVPQGAYVLIVSDHGFRADRAGKEISGTHFSGVRSASVFSLGRNIKPGSKIRPAILSIPYPTNGCRVLDITPTVLTWFGLPVADNLQGNPCTKLVEGLPDAPGIPGYPYVPPRPPEQTEKVRKMYTEIKKQLKSLGYLK